MLDPIFPGMDPFIENQRWPEFHEAMIIYLRDKLVRLLMPNYVVFAEKYIQLSRPDISIWKGRLDEAEALEQSHLKIAEATRLHTATLPDEEEQSRIEIYDTTGKLISVIEMISPANKTRNRSEYLKSRRRILLSDAHLIEIDLTRKGRRIEANLPEEGYNIFIARAQTDGPHYGEMYEIGLRDPLPVIPLPLDTGDIPLDLPSLFKQAYINGGYRLYLDYARPPAVPFSEADAAWVGQLLKEAHLVK
ncbi:MAG: hypothetical protein BroJett018_25470 [Chloroflexota bacterium]|nr:DUF4058 family protein [Chloroflexota bacterium]NOG66210.1 DUF4058 family protein [Chloroflexota bacterium]GIK64753.1 MAG: hypothetical protein BroJett018_25470 [Chloroflexota bacterium]